MLSLMPPIFLLDVKNIRKYCLHYNHHQLATDNLSFNLCMSKSGKLKFEIQLLFFNDMCHFPQSEFLICSLQIWTPKGVERLNNELCRFLRTLF